MGDRPDPSPTRPQAGRAGTLAVPCVLRRAAERAGVPGLGGGRAGGADQRRAHPTNTRATPYRIVNHPARNNRWNDPGIASTTRVSWDIRAMSARRGSSSVAGRSPPDR